MAAYARVFSLIGFFNLNGFAAWLARLLTGFYYYSLNGSLILKTRFLSFLLGFSQWLDRLATRSIVLSILRWPYRVHIVNRCYLCQTEINLWLFLSQIRSPLCQVVLSYPIASHLLLVFLSDCFSSLIGSFSEIGSPLWFVVFSVLFSTLICSHLLLVLLSDWLSFQTVPSSKQLSHLIGYSHCPCTNRWKFSLLALFSSWHSYL